MTITAGRDCSSSKVRSATADNRPVELRDIEIFLTLAAELHFGRTAQRLHLTPARVSQSIKAQERRIGAPLFERTTRTVRLTPLGKQLDEELRAAHRQIKTALQNAALAAGGGGVGTLTIGSMAAQAFTLGHVLGRLRARHPKIEIRMREIQPTAPLDELRSGHVDVAHVWLPVREPDLTVGPVLHTCPVVLAVGGNHPYAGRTSIRLEDLGDCTVVRGTNLPASMEEFFHPSRTPSGRPIRRGPETSSWHEILMMVAAGNAVTASGSDVLPFYAWPDIVYLPIEDAPVCEWAFVWRTEHETPLIRALADAAAEAPAPATEELTLPMASASGNR